MAQSKHLPGLKLRQVAAARLASVLTGTDFNPLTQAELADSRDRALANRLVTTALRRHGQLDRVLAHLLERGMPKKSSFEAMLRISLAQLLYLPELGDHSAIHLGVEAIKRDPKAPHVAGLMNAVLRRAQKEAEQLREAPDHLLFPERLATLWREAYGAAAVGRFAAALLEGAPLDLTLRDSDPALVVGLGGRPLLGDTIRIEARDSAVADMAGYDEGRWWVQDAAAALPARLIDLPPGARVLDLCAAPGGKTAQLIKAGYKLTALDDDSGRLERLNGNLKRLGYSAETLVADGLTYRPEALFDAVLLDAPCSATGIFRRHPEVVWHRQAADVASRVGPQRQFIRRAIDCLKPGGILVYCVCSLEPEEGENQARWALGANLGLTLVPITPKDVGGWADAVTPSGYLRTHPGLELAGGGTLDGFFAARFRRD